MWTTLPNTGTGGKITQVIPTQDPSGYRFRYWADQVWTWVLTLGVMAVTMGASFYFLRQLAIQTFWPVSTAWMLPICLDVLAAAALTQYRKLRSWYPFSVAMLAIFGSLAGNGLSHLIAAGLEPNFWIVFAVGSVPGISAGFVIHLFALEPATWKPEPTRIPSLDPAGEPNQIPDSEPNSTSKPEPTLVEKVSANGSADGWPNWTVNGSRSSGPASSSVTTTKPPPPVPPPPIGTAPDVKPSGTSKRSNRETKSTEQLAQLIRSNGWGELSGDKLAKLLGCRKQHALKAKAQVKQLEPFGA